MPIANIDDKYSWWSELRHGGMLISPPLLKEFFPKIAELSEVNYNKLRDKFTSFEAWKNKYPDMGKDTEIFYSWIDYVFETFLDHKPWFWEKSNFIEEKYKIKSIFNNIISPDRVLFSSEDKKDPILFVKIDKSLKIGTGKAKKTYAEFIELLRKTGVNLGVITNGSQFRICYSGINYDAWTEWDSSFWFIEEEWREQLSGFLTILGKDGLETKDNKNHLINAIEQSRNKQSELSTVLGQQIRDGVEIILEHVAILFESSPNLYEKISKYKDGTVRSEIQINDSLYQASCRILMRLVVILFAEAKNMLPKDIPLYNESYGIDGLFEQLKKAEIHEGRSSLKNMYGAWKRLLSLFNIVYEGSGHHILSLQGYGGSLFKKGSFDDSNEISRALALFEHEDFKLSDHDVFIILEKLKIGKLKIKQGKNFISVKGPVDFSDLRTEYIGMMYEGLLDYSLKKAHEPLVFLKIGKEPLMPLSLLESMTDKDIKSFIEKLKKDSKNDILKDEENEEDKPEIEIESESQEIEENSDETEEIYKPENSDQIWERAKNWALKAVNTSGMVKRQKNMDDAMYAKECEKISESLISKVLKEGEYYLLRAGGTRKGSGTFYTKPGLTVPTVIQTLDPLLYDINGELKTPKKPEEILAVKVCDPSCGSGSFLAAATEYITEVLSESIIYHERYTSQGNGKTRILPFATRSRGMTEEELIPVPSDDERFEEYLKAKLIRYVVERCIYGVDINPLSVELARLSLWINTMNSELPFTFLDHKIKVGNSLVGTWFDYFIHYPVMAWKREGADKNHTNGYNIKKGEGNLKISEYLKNIIKPEITKYIENLESEKLIKDEYEIINRETEETIKNAREIFEELHDIPMSAAGIRKREIFFREKLAEHEGIKKLKFAFDTWCALWFWNPYELDEDVPRPLNFHNLNEKTRERVKKIAEEQRFFHWELEFPDVFATKNSGFTAVIGNPPWDITKPNSREFFVNYDPVFRTYGKQEAIKKQTELFKINREIEESWINYNAGFKNMSNWKSYVSEPFNDGSIIKENKYKIWKEYIKNESEGFVDPEHPFKDQGKGDINLYKMFTELGLSLLKKEGRIGFIVPSGIYSDKGTQELRERFIEKATWELLFSFENKYKIFDIHGSYKFCICILIKNNKKTEKVKTAFMMHELSVLKEIKNYTLDFKISTLKILSPENLGFLEIQSDKDMKIIEKMYSNGRLISDKEDNYEISFGTEFHMTNDSHLFTDLNSLLEKGFKRDEYGRYIKNNDVYYPLYQGVMINQFDYAAKKYLYGTGVNAKWEDNSWANKEIISSYYVKNELFYEKFDEIKLYFRDITSSTNQRTLISSIIPNYFAGNTLIKIELFNSIFKDYLNFTNVINSFCFDFLMRFKCTGSHVSLFIIKETVIPKKELFDKFEKYLITYNASLQLSGVVFAKQWLEIASIYPEIKKRNWYSLWALTDHERLRLRCILDSVIAEFYGLDYEDLAWILKNDPNDPKGFWRVDKDKPEELRQTTLTLEAFKHLKDVGIEEFLKENYRFRPEIEEQFGDRYFSWQNEKNIEQSWNECREHAEKFHH